ncbi:MAG: CopD family protein [Gammaproteobacteria bacterium]
MMVDGLSAALRALSFVAMFQTAGMAMFLALFGHLLFESRAGTRRIAAGAALIAIVLTIAHYLLEAARMSGDFAGTMDPALQGLVLHSSTSVALALRITGLALLFVVLRWSGAAAITAVGILLVLGAFVFAGHTATHGERWLLGSLLLVHLLIVAFWFGALVPLARAGSLEATARAGAVVDAFSAIALWFVPVLFVAGVCLAIFLIATVEALRSTYAQLLLVKVVLFATLLGLGALNKWRLGPAVGRGDSRALVRFNRTLTAEYILIAAALCVTAVLTTFYSPGESS